MKVRGSYVAIAFTFLTIRLSLFYGGDNGISLRSPSPAASEETPRFRSVDFPTPGTDRTNFSEREVVVLDFGRGWATPPYQSDTGDVTRGGKDFVGDAGGSSHSVLALAQEISSPFYSSSSYEPDNVSSIASFLMDFEPHISSASAHFRFIFT